MSENEVLDEIGKSVEKFEQLLPALAVADVFYFDKRAIITAMLAHLAGNQAKPVNDVMYVEDMLGAVLGDLLESGKGSEEINTNVHIQILAAGFTMNPDQRPESDAGWRVRMKDGSNITVGAGEHLTITEVSALCPDRKWLMPLF